MTEALVAEQSACRFVDHAKAIAAATLRAAASELTERIKALKSANTIETTPQRVQRKQVAAAEEPITARVRRRQEAHPAPGQAGEHDAAMEAAGEVRRAKQQDSAAANAPGMTGANGKPLTFRERIELERQQQVQGEGQTLV